MMDDDGWDAEQNISEYRYILHIYVIQETGEREQDYAHECSNIFIFE
jgi:hypothetical protein